VASATTMRPWALDTIDGAMDQRGACERGVFAVHIATVSKHRGVLAFLDCSLSKVSSLPLTLASGACGLLLSKGLLDAITPTWNIAQSIPIAQLRWSLRHMLGLASHLYLMFFRHSHGLASRSTTDYEVCTDHRFFPDALLVAPCPSCHDCAGSKGEY